MSMLLWFRAALAALLLCATAAHAEADFVLQEHGSNHRLEGTLHYLVDAEGRSTIQDIAKNHRANFSPASTERSLPLRGDHHVWVRISLKRGEDNTGSAWTLHLPLPYLDYAALYQSDGKGGWSRQVAGDTIAVNDWFRPFLYPDFDLQIPPDGAIEVYLELRNFKPTLTPIFVVPENRRDSQRELEHLLFGGLFGTLLMLVGVCAIHYAQSRNADDGWYTLYAAFMVVVVASMTGLSGLWLWPRSPAWSNYTHLAMPIFGLSATLVFVRQITSLDAGFPRLSQTLYAAAGFGIPIALLGLAVDRYIADYFNAAYLAISPVLLLTATLQTWRRGHAIGRWLTLGFAPMGLVVLYIGLQLMQIAPAWWASRYLVAVTVALAVPLLQQALHLRVRERREAEERANAVQSQDALTGLLTRPLFEVQMERAIRRAHQHREPSAIVMVEIVNYGYLKDAYGDAVAEQCLLRAAVKVHRVLRDVDPAGRVDTARFGLVLDGVASRQALTERMVRLIASGLIPLPGVRPEVTLQFHISCVLLTEVVPDKRTVLTELADLLHRMSPRTRRPIRFLERLPTHPSGRSELDSQPNR